MCDPSTHAPALYYHAACLVLHTTLASANSTITLQNLKQHIDALQKQVRKMNYLPRIETHALIWTATMLCSNPSNYNPDSTFPCQINYLTFYFQESVTGQIQQCSGSNSGSSLDKLILQQNTDRNISHLSEGRTTNTTGILL